MGKEEQMAEDELDGLGRFTDPSVLIMSSLAEGPKHGYAITKDIEAFGGVSLGPGTLYGALSRLESRGLIEAVASTQRRQPYRLTARGTAVLVSQLRSLESVAAAGLARLAMA